MLKPGDKITVRYSKKIAQTGNLILVNRTGIITKAIYMGDKLTGVYADIQVMRRLRNYYIPGDSIEGVDEINRLRTLSLLKSTIL